MNEYEYTVELYAVKTLRVRANNDEEADRQADLIVTTETIPVTQDDIVEINITDVYDVKNENTKLYQRFDF